MSPWGSCYTRSMPTVSRRTGACTPLDGKLNCLRWTSSDGEDNGGNVPGRRGGDGRLQLAHAARALSREAVGDRWSSAIAFPSGREDFIGG